MTYCSLCEVLDPVSIEGPKEHDRPSFTDHDVPYDRLVVPKMRPRANHNVGVFHWKRVGQNSAVKLAVRVENLLTAANSISDHLLIGTAERFICPAREYRPETPGLGIAESYGAKITQRRLRARMFQAFRRLLFLNRSI